MANAKRRSARTPVIVDTTLARTRTERPGDNLECCHPRCSAAPQQRYDFPIPLCGRHMVKVLTRSTEVADAAKRDHVVANGKALPIQRGALVKSGHATFSHAPVVYYLRFGDRVKIGVTTNLRSRLTQIPHDEVMAAEPGDESIERHRHRQFATERVNGEWFTLSNSLAEHIATLRSKQENSGIPYLGANIASGA